MTDKTNARIYKIESLLTRQEMKEFETMKTMYEMGSGPLIRWSLFNKHVTVSSKAIDERVLFDIEQIMASNGKIGSNLNQISKHLNEGESASMQLLGEIHASISDLYKTNHKLTQLYKQVYGDNKTYFQ
jgi:hypothetical protein